MSRHQNITDMAKLTLCLIVLAAPAALAGDLPPALLPVGIDPNMVIHFDPNELSRLLADWGPEGVYKRQGAEVVPWMPETALPSPDNAALLYYQAFLLRRQPDETTFLAISDFLAGGEPDRQIRVYLGTCREMIHAAEVASHIPQCTWGIRHLDTSGFRETYLLGEIRQLALLLELDARMLAADGHYDASLARCLTIRRLAQHVGDDTMLAYLVSQAADALARRAMQCVLGLMPPDADTLQALRGQLTAIPGASGPIQKAMQADLNLLFERKREDTSLLDGIRQELAENAENQQVEEETLNLTDDEILALAREPYQRFLHRVSQVIDSDMPYEQKYAEIDTQTAALIENYRDDPAASYVKLQYYVFVDGTVECWNIGIRNTAAYNALKTAIDIYLIRAQTGQLPETLPAHSPKDPFSGQDFEYEITPTGFVLRCRARDIHEDKIWEYEFLVQD